MAAAMVTLVSATGHQFQVTERQARGVYADYRRADAPDPEPEDTAPPKRAARKPKD